MEETGKLKVLFDFPKSFAKFATDTGIVANLDGNNLVLWGNTFGIQIVLSNEYDPDNVGFVRWLCKCQYMSCVNGVLQYICYSKVEKSLICCWAK